jgi:nucleotide-binding universal stress UspA family protein
MYTRILVVLDGTPEADAALTPAHTLAAALGAAVSQLPVDSSESPEEAVVAAANTRGADLVAMAAHDVLPHHVLQHLGVPLLLVPPGQADMTRLNQVLAPVDGSPGSLVGLGQAASLARAAGCALALLRVVRPLPLWIYDPALGLNTGALIDPRWDEDRRSHAEAYVRQVASKVAESGLEVGADALLGEVAPTIVDYADSEAVDLIVMSTHARTGPIKALLGSTAEEVVRRAHQPVLLVRRHAGDETLSTTYGAVPTSVADTGHGRP